MRSYEECTDAAPRPERSRNRGANGMESRRQKERERRRRLLVGFVSRRRRRRSVLFFSSAHSSQIGARSASTKHEGHPKIRIASLETEANAISRQNQSETRPLLGGALIDQAKERGSNEGRTKPIFNQPPISFPPHARHFPREGSNPSRTVLRARCGRSDDAGARGDAGGLGSRRAHFKKSGN